MDEIGELLKEKRIANAVELDEVSLDLGISKEILDNLECGNTRVFNDILKLKEVVLLYSKYLGLNEEEIKNKLNEYLFARTSKINLDDLKIEKREQTVQIHSPYTKKIKEINKDTRWYKNSTLIALSFGIAIILISLLILKLLLVKENGFFVK